MESTLVIILICRTLLYLMGTVRNIDLFYADYKIEIKSKSIVIGLIPSLYAFDIKESILI